jgi:hypothetical protein
MRQLFNRSHGETNIPAETAVPLRVRIAVLLALVPVVLFTVACLVYNAPASPARNRVAAAATDFMEPYFWQDWQLFGPTPGDNNSLIYLQTQIKLPSGRVVQTSPIEIEKSIDQSPQQFRVNPTKLPGVLLAFDQAAQHYDQAATNIKKLPTAERSTAQTNLDEAYATDFLEMRRFFSAQASILYPQSQILAVRATFDDQPIVPFSDRYESPQPKEPVQALLVTSWLAYVPGVAQ